MKIHSYVLYVQNRWRWLDFWMLAFSVISYVTSRTVLYRILYLLLFRGTNLFKDAPLGSEHMSYNWQISWFFHAIIDIYKEDFDGTFVEINALIQCFILDVESQIGSGFCDTVEVRRFLSRGWFFPETYSPKSLWIGSDFVKLSILS